MAMLDTHIMGGVARVTLNRPEVHNAFNAAMIAELTEAFDVLGRDDAVRVIVLAAAGKNFSAGADLSWMQQAAQQDEAANRQDAERLAHMFAIMNACPKPVIGLVQGAALGGGVGLVACCDMVIATPDAQFGLTEVRLGLIPAVISPFVIGKIGISAARYHMLSGERFDVEEAMRIGLIHDVGDELDKRAVKLVNGLLASAPGAIADIKRLVAEIDGRGTGADTLVLTAQRIAARRASDEGREGMAAFLEKRKPGWSDVH